MENKKPILCLDFDGVIHSCTSGWQGATVIPDPPVPGAIPFMYEALEHFNVAVFSSRSNQPYGINAMQDWLRSNAIDLIHTGLFEFDPNLCWLDCIQWPKEKPPALVTIDDRAITFDGTWPNLQTLLSFKPWYKK